MVDDRPTTVIASANGGPRLAEARRQARLDVRQELQGRRAVPGAGARRHRLRHVREPVCSQLLPFALLAALWKHAVPHLCMCFVGASCILCWTDIAQFAHPTICRLQKPNNRSSRFSAAPSTPLLNRVWILHPRETLCRAPCCLRTAACTRGR